MIDAFQLGFNTSDVSLSQLVCGFKSCKSLACVHIASVTAASAYFIAYINRNGNKKVKLVNGDQEISLENANHLEVAEFIENASKVVFKDDGDKKPT